MSPHASTPNFFATLLRNTKGDADELRAYPQYVNAKAYDVLRQITPLVLEHQGDDSMIGVRPPVSFDGVVDDTPQSFKMGDYTLHVTFNDDVMGENIKFLTLCVMSLGLRNELIGSITRAMDCMQRLQQPAPQAGWGLQHLSRTTNGRPAGLA